MDELIELLGPAVDGRVFVPKLPEDTRRKGMRERYTTEFPAIAVREMATPPGVPGLIQVRCYGGNPAEAKALAREVVGLIEADGRWLFGDRGSKLATYLRRGDLQDHPDDESGGPVCHIALKLEARKEDSPALTALAAGETA